MSNCSQILHLLDLICENLSLLSDVAAFDASEYRHFNFIMKQFFKMTLMGKAGIIEEPVKAIHAIGSSSKILEHFQTISRALGLVQDGVCISLDSSIAISWSCLPNISGSRESPLEHTALVYEREVLG